MAAESLRNGQYARSSESDRAMLLSTSSRGRQPRPNRLSPDDVVDLDYLGGTRELDAALGEDRHQTLPERLELLLGVPDFADPEAATSTERNMQLEPVGRELARGLDASLGRVVLLGCQAGRGCETNQDAHVRSSVVYCTQPIPRW